MKKSQTNAAEVDARRNKRHWPDQVINEEPFHPVSLTLRTPVLPPLPWRIRRLVRDTYAANGGPDRMTLDQWRAAERQIKEWLENERSNSSQ